MNSKPSTLPAIMAAATLWSAAALADGPGVGAYREQGLASVYHDKYGGRRTASGRLFRQDQLTAAHRTLPFGSQVTAIDLATGRSVEVVITDRGPFIDGRIIDLSRKAADALGIAGTAPVVIQLQQSSAVPDPGSPRAAFPLLGTGHRAVA